MIINLSGIFLFFKWILCFLKFVYGIIVIVLIYYVYVFVLCMCKDIFSVNKWKFWNYFILMIY